MTETTVFAFTRAANDVVNIRTTMIDGDPWFVGADILRVLYGSPAGKGSAYLKLDPTEIAKVDRINFEPRGGHPMVLVSESGLYKLILRSDKPEARVFQNWVTQEVLPSIRKTGKYALADHGREAMPLPMDIAEAMATVLDQMGEVKTKLDALLAAHAKAAENEADLNKMVTASQALSMGFGAGMTTGEMGYALTVYSETHGLPIQRPTKKAKGPFGAVNRYSMRAVKGRFG